MTATRATRRSRCRWRRSGRGQAPCRGSREGHQASAPRGAGLRRRRRRGGAGRRPRSRRWSGSAPARRGDRRARRREIDGGERDEHSVVGGSGVARALHSSPTAVLLLVPPPEIAAQMDGVTAAGGSGSFSAWPRSWPPSGSRCQAMARGAMPWLVSWAAAGIIFVMISATIWHVVRNEVGGGGHYLRAADPRHVRLVHAVADAPNRAREARRDVPVNAFVEVERHERSTRAVAVRVTRCAARRPDRGGTPAAPEARRQRPSPRTAATQPSHRPADRTSRTP